MNKLKLSLENFQSISQGELEFETGLNFIIGQSNSGKSATFRALKACLSNGSGSQRFIKKGTKQAAVTLDYMDNSITWKRTSKESSYIINGEDYVKTGNSNAFKILEDTGFTKDSNDVIMNIEEELQLPFPFGISKSDLFKLYEDVFCISDSSVILKSAKEHEEEVKNSINNLEVECLKNKRKLEELNKFKEEVDFKQLESYKLKFIGIQDKLDSLKDGLDVIEKAIKIENADLDINNIQVENKLEEYRDLIETCNIFERTKRLNNLDKYLKGLNINIIPRVQNYDELKALKKTMENLKALNALKFMEIEFQNKLEQYNELKKYLSSIETICNKIKENSKKLKEVNEKIEDLDSELQEYKVCPLCHSPLQ